MSENSDQKGLWYAVHTYSGYENKVKINLDKSVEHNGLQDRIFETWIPVEEVVEIKNNKRHVTERKLMPGYVFVRMMMDEKTWYIVRNTRGVTGFVGMGKEPMPLSDEDLKKLINYTSPKELDIAVGDTVRILNGTFENVEGTVTRFNEDKTHVFVNVSLFKKETEVEVETDEVVRADGSV